MVRCGVLPYYFFTGTWTRKKPSRRSLGTTTKRHGDRPGYKAVRRKQDGGLKHLSIAKLLNSPICCNYCYKGMREWQVLLEKMVGCR